MNRPLVKLILLMLCLIPIGCGTREPQIDRTYGRLQGNSINGTGAFAELLRSKGHEVRAAIRATDNLPGWADVLVRFSPQPGEPDQEEAEWLMDWLREKAGRKVVYIPRDYDSEPEFWQTMLEAQPPGTDPSILSKIERRRDAAKSWVRELPPKAKTTANPADWFGLQASSSEPSVCKTLEGPWAEDVDSTKSALVRHHVFKAEGDELVLLKGDGVPLAMTWTFENRSEVLVLANATYLLNASLLNRARRPLTLRVVDWIGNGPSHVAFLEGRRVSAAKDEEPVMEKSPFGFMGIEPWDWISCHILAFLILLALSFASRLGRPLPEPASGVERPSAHPEALGVLLAKTGRADAARFLLDAYRRWRLSLLCRRPHGLGSFPNLPMSPPLMTESDEIEFLDDQPKSDPAPEPASPSEAEPEYLDALPLTETATSSEGLVALWAAKVMAQVNKVYVGQDNLVRGVLAALLADGHVLIESVPGLGKTLLVRALGRVLGCDFNRIQFTPDLMPSDVTGSPVYDERVHDFRFRPGPVFTQLLLADEINRAPAKTHSALLEIMQEYRVTVDGTSHPIERPFLVLATQNPIESEGTYNLPEAQLDRFLFKLIAGYPSANEETSILRLHTLGSSPDAILTSSLETVTNPAEVLEVQKKCGAVLVDDRVLNYIASIVRKTREWPTFSLGASPRAGVAILRGARAVAALEGRDFAVPDDVQEVAPWALRHRVMLTPEAEVEGQGADDLLAELIRSVEVPRA